MGEKLVRSPIHFNAGPPQNVLHYRPVLKKKKIFFFFNLNVNAFFFYLKHPKHFHPDFAAKTVLRNLYKLKQLLGAEIISYNPTAYKT